MEDSGEGRGLWQPGDFMASPERTVAAQLKVMVAMREYEHFC